MGHRRRLGGRVVVAVSLCMGLGVLTSAQAQIGGLDLTQLLQNFGGLVGQGGTTPTQPIGTTTQPSTPGSGTGTRQPTISAADQFNATSGESLRARSPGAYVQNAMAVQTNDQEFIDGSGMEDPDSFYKETFDMIALGVIEQFTSLIESLNLLSGLGGGIPGVGGSGGATIQNPATTGAGTTTTIP